MPGFPRRPVDRSRPFIPAERNELDMYSLGILTFASCLLCLLLTPIIRNWSIRFGLVDHPDNQRKVHMAATPRTGGVPILISYLGAYAILLLLPTKASRLIGDNLG